MNTNSFPKSTMNMPYIFSLLPRGLTFRSCEPVSQEILSLGNSVAATIFPKEIMSLSIIEATVFPKEIMSLSIIEATVFPKEIMSLPGNCVAHARCTCSIDTSWQYDMLLAFCCDCKYVPTRVFNERKGLYPTKSKELHSEGRFAILSRQRQQGIPSKLHA